MSLHNEIMNISVDEGKALSMVSQTAYKYGHRDARHAAAEIALKYERALHEAQSTLESIAICDSDFPDHMAQESLKEIEKILSEKG